MARLRDARTRSDTIAITIQVALRPDSMLDVGASADYGGNGAVVATRGEDAPSTWAIDAWSPRADEFALEDGDRIFVRRLPGYVPPATVGGAGTSMTPWPTRARRRT